MKTVLMLLIKCHHYLYIPEVEEKYFRSESLFSDAIESDLKDESKYEDIDDLRTDKQGYLEYATDSISVVQSGNLFKVPCMFKLFFNLNMLK
jgi:hypothetical protein